MPPVQSKPPASLRLRLSTAAETQIRAGHPWVFAQSVHDQNRAGRLGEVGVVYDRRNRFLAVGLFDPDSPIRLRILHVGKPELIGPDWWAGRLRAAVARRQGLFDQWTTGFRWINGETDGFPGLVLDRYDTTLVLKLYTAAWLPTLSQILGIIGAALAPQCVVLRLSRNIQSIAQERFQVADGQLLSGQPVHEPVWFQESGLWFESDVVRGQKTGFFLDQRQNRQQVEGLARGCAVLNAFSFTGGFSVYAARGGARSVLELDISAPALAAAQRNFARNGLAAAGRGCQRQAIRADAFEWLAGSARAQFDLVVLDPPALAKRQEERAGALRAYGRLARLALSRLRPGGVLVACSCSAQVSAEDFFQAVRKSAASSGRRVEEFLTTGQPPDHWASFPEAQYLKAIYLRVSGSPMRH